MKPLFPSASRGSALLIVLCAIALMTVAVLELVEFSDIGLQETATQGKDFRALQLAESGVALGLHPQIDRRDKLLQQTIASGEAFEVHLQGEGGRLNINTVLLQNQTEILTNLFGRWGLKPDEVSHVVDCLMDWVDSDSLTRLNGAEQKEYAAIGLPNYPPNRPFQSVDEMALVLGMDRVAKLKKNWKDYFTVWSDGKLDLNAAPAELIEVVCNVGSVVAENFVRSRLGSDGIIDTDDDITYTDMGQIQTELGLSANSLTQIQNRITLKSDYRRIESTGKVGPYQRKIMVVIKLNSNPIQYLAWIES